MLVAPLRGPVDWLDSGIHNKKACYALASCPALQAQLRLAHRTVEETKEELHRALAVAAEAAAEAEARTRDAAAAGHVAVAAEAAKERAVAREAEATAAAQAAEAARQQLQAELEQLKFDKQEVSRSQHRMKRLWNSSQRRLATA